MKQAKSDRYEVRSATLEDVEELVRMRLVLQKHMEDNNKALWPLSEKKISVLPSFYRNQIEDVNARLVVVQENESGSIVGMGLGRIRVHDDYIPNRSGRIDDVWVEPHHRRKGLCARVVSVLLGFFKSNNVEFLHLNYAEGNAEAESVWKHWGFRPVVITTTAKLNRVKCNVMRSR